MRNVRVKLLRKKLQNLIPDPTKQQWRRFKFNYMNGLV